MTAGVLQLVAVNVQDLYLTSKPQITFFRMIYRRYTNFNSESVVQNFASPIPANFDESLSCAIAKLGDLIGAMYLYVELPPVPVFKAPFKKFAWCEYLGYTLLQQITMNVGGRLMDVQNGEYLYLKEALTSQQPYGIMKMVGQRPEVYNFTNGKEGVKVYIPLAFWPNRNHGTALPVIGLSSSDITFNVKFRRADECYRIGPTNSIVINDDVTQFRAGDYIEQTTGGQSVYGYVIDFDYLTKKLYYLKIYNKTSTKRTFDASSPIYNSLTGAYVQPISPEQIENTDLENFQPNFINSYFLVDFIYLGKEERARFARATSEYLVEQIQYNQTLNIASSSNKFILNLINPCKEMIWIGQLDRVIGPGTINDRFNFTSSHIRYPDGRFYGKNITRSATLILDGLERFMEFPGEYFNYLEPYYHHYRGPQVGINNYSFALFPELFQPSGSCNMSKLDDLTLNLKVDSSINNQNTCSIRCYTSSYNVFRCAFGLGATAFSYSG